MRRLHPSIIAACFGAIAALIASATPTAAFGLRLGPFHLGLPFGFRHHFVHHHVALRRADRESGIEDKADLGRVEPAQRAQPALLYPAIALPILYDEIFWPDRSRPWPFGYDAIFRSAFAKSPLDDDARACQQPDRTAEFVGRIRAEVKPQAAQLPLLQKLGAALGMASGYLMKACPKTVPAQPVARLQLMQSQLQVLGMAIDIVRPPLQQFEQSLDPTQKAHFGAATDRTSACGAAPAATEWSVDEIDQAVEPDDKQSKALADLKQAFAGAAADLHAHCPVPSPPTPLARLEAMESRLDASWRAALSMQVALAAFESRLNAQQRGRFEAMNLAQAR